MYEDEYKPMDESDMRLPCKCCREQAMGAGGGYCKECLTNVILDYYKPLYPVSSKDIYERLKRWR